MTYPIAAATVTQQWQQCSNVSCYRFSALPRLSRLMYHQEVTLYQNPTIVCSIQSIFQGPCEQRALPIGTVEPIGFIPQSSSFGFYQTKVLSSIVCNIMSYTLEPFVPKLQQRSNTHSGDKKKIVCSRLIYFFSLSEWDSHNETYQIAMKLHSDGSRYYTKGNSMESNWFCWCSLGALVVGRATGFPAT